MGMWSYGFYFSPNHSIRKQRPVLLLMFMIVLLAWVPAHAAPSVTPATLIRDFNTTSYQKGISSTYDTYCYYSSPCWDKYLPYELLEVNDTWFVTVWDSRHGDELWMSDASSENTILLKDINPGTSGSRPSNFTQVQDTVFFAADDGSAGRELWKSDGTPAGTVMVKDINVGGASSSPWRLTAFQGNVYFSVEVNDKWELWRSDGTAAGTRQVAAMPASNLVATQNSLFFTTWNETNRNELWITDGTVSGTRLVKVLHPDWSIDGLMAIQDLVFFAGWDSINGQELWRSDGTAAGTYMVKDIALGSNNSDPSSMVSLGGNLFFFASDLSHGRELWRSNGTTTGTVRITSFEGIKHLSHLSNVDGTLFFTIHREDETQQLWRSDGTTAGTRMVKSFETRELGSLVSMNDKLFLRVDNDFWISDGTAAGTRQLRSFAGELWNFVVGENSIALSVSDEALGYTLWMSNGTSSGTIEVLTSVRAQGDTNVEQFATLNDDLFFTVRTDANNVTLWFQDGENNTLTQVQNARRMRDLTPFREKLAFASEDAQGRWSIWTTDGTSEGTVAIRPPSNNHYYSNLTYFAGELFFSVYSNELIELWRSDGTAAGTQKVMTFPSDPDWMYASVDDFTYVGGTLFFSFTYTKFGPPSAAVPSLDTHISPPVSILASTSTYYELWRSDGTADGTQRVRVFGTQGCGGGTCSEPAMEQLTAVNNRLFFKARDVGEMGSFLPLWVSDGTADGTQQLTSSSAIELTASGDALFFTTHTAETGHELWMSNGTQEGTQLVKDILPGAVGSLPFDLTNVDGTLFFTANDGQHGREVWRSNGTAATTRMVKDINPGLSGGAPTQLTAVHGKLVFSASDGIHGVEPWRSDGTTAGTQLIDDVAVGEDSSNPHNFHFAETRMVFVANDGLVGDEPWVVSAATTAVSPEGGQLESWLDGTSYRFSPGTFETPVTVTHQRHSSAALPARGFMVPIDHTFVVEARSPTDEVVQPAIPYTITINYTKAEVGPVIESSLALYFWDGEAWIKELSSVVDADDNRLTATPNRFGRATVLGETNRIWLPVVGK